jgi:hypothetical protein
MPLYRACRSAASTTSSAKTSTTKSLGRIQAAIDAGKLDAKETVTAGAGQGRRDPPRQGRRALLGDGELKAKLTFDVAGASKPAIAAVEKAGGSSSSCAGEGSRRGLAAEAARGSPPLAKAPPRGLYESLSHRCRFGGMRRRARGRLSVTKRKPI